MADKTGKIRPFGHGTGMRGDERVEDLPHYASYFKATLRTCPNSPRSRAAMAVVEEAQ